MKCPQETPDVPVFAKLVLWQERALEAEKRGRSTFKGNKVLETEAEKKNKTEIERLERE